MATKYRLLKSGQMVSTFRSTTKSPQGKDIHLTQNRVGRKGDEFEDLPEFQVEKIKASIDADEGKWEIVEEDQGNDEESDGEPEVSSGQGDPDGEPSSEPEPPAPHGHEADEGHEHETTFVGLSGERLHALPVQGTGAQGKVKNEDMVKALQVEHGQS